MFMTAGMDSCHQAKSWLEAPDGFTVANIETGTFSVRHAVAGVYSLKCLFVMWWTLRRWYPKSSPTTPMIGSWFLMTVIVKGLTSLLDFQVTVTDVYDNVVSNPEIVLVSDAVDGLEAIAGGQYRWAVEGDHRVTALGGRTSRS